MVDLVMDTREGGGVEGKRREGFSPAPGRATTTRSPLLSVVTPSPTEVTTPTPSPPPTAGKGGRIAYTPVNIYHNVVTVYTTNMSNDVM